MESFQSNLYVDTNFFAFILTRYSYTNVNLHIIKEVEKVKRYDERKRGMITVWSCFSKDNAGCLLQHFDLEQRGKVRFQSNL